MTEKSLLVAVGSTNPTKIEPVKQVFAHYFPHIDVRNVKVHSSVDDQPMSDEVMYEGALHRAQEALHAFAGADFGIGIEGGLHKRSYGWFEHSLVVIIDKTGKIGVGASGGLVLPDKIMQRIHQGENLEQAIDHLFGTKKIGTGIGMFGMMTKGVVTRTSGVAHGVAFALAPFLHPDLY